MKLGRPAQEEGYERCEVDGVQVFMPRGLPVLPGGVEIRTRRILGFSSLVVTGVQLPAACVDCR